MKLKNILLMTINSIKGFVNEFIDLCKKEHLEHKKAVECKHREAIECKKQNDAVIKEQNIKYVSSILSTYFCADFADAFNALPHHMKLAQTHIDPLALRNSFENNSWVLSVNVENANVYSLSLRKQLMEQLQLILDNMNRECIRDINDYLSNDAWNYHNAQISYALYGQVPQKTDAQYLNAYSIFYKDMLRKLYKFVIIDIVPTSTSLCVLYNVVSEQDVYSYDPKNYFNLVSMLLNSL